MSERLTPDEVLRMTPAQEDTLRRLCERFGVEFAHEHYFVYPHDSFTMAGYATGWLGGDTHANPEYAMPAEPAGKPTIYVGVSPEGDASS